MMSHPCSAEAIPALILPSLHSSSCLFFLDLSSRRYKVAHLLHVLGQVASSLCDATVCNQLPYSFHQSSREGVKLHEEAEE